MKKLPVLVLVLVGLIFTQIIDWETTIPFESADDGPVGIDIDINGNILVTCYTNGPNLSEWNVDTLKASPHTKVVTLDPGGNIIDSDDFGVLFNDKVVGIGCTETGYTLFGNQANYYYNYEDYYTRSAWLVNFESDIRDTLKHSSYESSGYSFRNTKTNYLNETAAKYISYGVLDGSAGRDYLINIDGEDILNPDSLSHPDSLATVIGHFCIYDFDFHSNNGFYFVGLILDFVHLGYNYIIKMDDSNNIIWEKYFPRTYSIHSPEFISVASDSGGGCLVSLWNDQNGDNNRDPLECFLRKYSSNGETFYESSPLLNHIWNIYYIGNDQYIGLEQNSNKVYKFTDTGSTIQTDWVEEINNDRVIRPLDNGFILASTEGSNIIVKKYNATTGIEDPSLLPRRSQLYQNYPNPFNPITEISYSISILSDVELSIFNVNGELVEILVDKQKDKGNYSIQFNAESLNSGIYFYKLSVDGITTQTRKMILIK